jgi:hypothetical protein
MAWHTAGGRDVVLGAVDLEGDAVIDDAIESHAARCLVRASELDKGEASFVVAANKQTNKDVLARSQWGGRSAWQSGSYSRFGRTQHRPAGTHMLVAEITGLPGASACPSDNIACSAQSGNRQVNDAHDATLRLDAAMPPSICSVSHRPEHAPTAAAAADTERTETVGAVGV